MRSDLIRKSGLALLTAVLAVVSLAPRAMGQADFPNLQGAGQRPGHNSDPVNYNSGRTQLQWFTPYGIQPTTFPIVDNTDFPANWITANPPGPYDSNPYGFAADFAGVNSSGWLAPASIEFEATDPYTEPSLVNNVPPNYGPRTPDYAYALCTPSAGQGNPNVAADPTKEATFTWTFLNTNPPVGTTAWNPTGYALYVWLPVGPTGDATGQNYTYPQEFFVYQITYGNNQTYIDVVDTYQAGGGWVRLGSGGFNGNVVFPWDGVHPIQIQLLNTIPYNQQGQLTGTTGQCVYADAAKIVPVAGTYAASPVSAYVRDINGNPLVDAGGDPDVLTGGNPGYFARILSAENMLNLGLQSNQIVSSSQGQVRCYQMNPQRWTFPPVSLGNGTSTPGVPTVLWNYSPLVQSNFAVSIVNGTSSAGFNTDNLNPNYQGTFYYSAPLAISPNPATGTVTYDTTASLSNGLYTVYAYVPGNGGGETYGDAVQYQIWEGGYPGGTPVYTGSLNEQQPGGWVQLGSRAFSQAVGGALPGALVVVITNQSTDPNDAGKLAYANAVKFVGQANLEINSTPVISQVTINKNDGTSALIQVAIVADESGKIHCLDYLGNGDGTTTEYWSYPSTPNPNLPGWTDPNLQLGIDGKMGTTVPIAQMPLQFNLSTAVIQHNVPGAASSPDRMYIASTNGRIYCIDMAGRGDYTTTQPGTTQRLWSFPNDYPNPAIVQKSPLGSFRGSLVYGDANDGLAGPTILAAAPQGRVYSLDALGNQVTRTTTVNWTYPVLTAPALAPIVMTPSLMYTASQPITQLFFGTQLVPDTDAPGTLYALNATTGLVNWFFDGVNNGAKAGFNNLPYNAAGAQVSGLDNVLGWTTGPVTAPVAMLQEPGSTSYPVTTQDTVYALNDNLHLYGFNALTGAFANSTDGTRPYDDPELGVTSYGNLGFEWMTLVDHALNTRPIPVVTIPTAEGHIYGLFANTDDYNYFSGTGAAAPNLNYTSLTAYQTQVSGTYVTSAAFSNKRMIEQDDAGFMYVFDDNTGNFGLETSGNPPAGQFNSAPGQPGPSDAFRFLHIKLVNRATYNALRNVSVIAGTGASVGSLGYSDILQASAAATPAPPPNKPYSFEWGQTMYIAVFGYKYAYSDSNGNPVVPPQANIRISVGGKVIRQLQVDSNSFSSSEPIPALYNPLGDTWPTSWDPAVEDGYAVVAFTPQNAGPNALPPGQASITADLTSAAPTGVSQEIASDPNPVSADPADTADGGTVGFSMDNPLAIQMVGPYAGTTQAYTIGAVAPAVNATTTTTNSYDSASQVNGSPNVNGIPYDQLMESTGYGPDGLAATAMIYVWDRSLMTLIRPAGQGLDLVKVDRSDLQWQGGAVTVYNALNPASNPNLYPNFEDLPSNSPNVSLDYPDIVRDNVQLAFNVNGNVFNPLIPSSSASLTPPTSPTGTQLTENSSDSDEQNRVLVATPLQITVNVPKYQPAVNTGAAGFVPDPTGQNVAGDVIDFKKYDSAGSANEPQGYYGLLHVFVDSMGSGQLNPQDSYRSTHLAVATTPNWRIMVNTPNVDLGSLAGGTGYSPGPPGSQNPLLTGVPGNFNPWTGTWASVYQPFELDNDSNINLLDLRIAKASDVQTGSDTPLKPPLTWPIFSGANDILSWLQGSVELQSNIDSHWAMVNPNQTGGPYLVMDQKPRVTDQVPHPLDVNPHPRPNANLGVGTNAADLNPNYDLYGHSPKVAVSLPFGFPAGTYSAPLNVIEDTAFSNITDTQYPEIWDPLTGLNATEPFSNPALNLSFTVRETRVTNTNTPNASPVADSLLPSNPASSAWSNGTPGAMRDQYGSIVTAWESNRPGYATPVSPANPVPSNDTGRIFVGTVGNSASFAPQTSSSITNLPIDPILSEVVPNTQLQAPLSDLEAFTPGANSWMTGQTPNGFPAAGTTLFTGDSYGTDQNNGGAVGGLDRYDRPAFPIDGERNPLWQYGGNANAPFFTGSFMAFVGRAPMSSGTVESRVFLAPVNTSQGGGLTFGTTVSTSDPVNGNPFNDDPTTPKGKPSVVQTTNASALVFYPTTQAGRTAIHSARYTGSAFAPFVPLNFGPGFDNVTDPSACARPYLGSNPLLHEGGNTNTPGQAIDLTFSGRLKGRPNSEIYLGRLMYSPNGDGTYHLVDAAGKDEELPGAGSPFAFMAQQVNERLLSEGNGLFRARGVEWDRTQPIALYQYNASSGQPTQVLDTTTQVVDRETGLITYDTYLGGKVTVDPDLGTIRFTTSAPAQNVELRLTYTPAFLRVTNGGSAAYSGPQGIYDDHYIGDLSSSNTTAGPNYAEWFNPNGTAALPSANIQSGRSMFLFGKAASGNGQTARPFMTTMRFGLRLPTRIATAPGGAPVAVAVSGNTGPYELDPANGRVYFTAADEDNPNVSVTYTGVDESTGGTLGTPITVAGTISYVLEKDETPVLIDEAVNEGSLSAFLDPFTYQNNATMTTSRPPLIWMFYSSTRAGGPDIYFQTIAPSLLPVVK